MYFSDLIWDICICFLFIRYRAIKVPPSTCFYNIKRCLVWLSWAESSKLGCFWPSCLLKLVWLRPSCLGPTFLWAELSWTDLSLGRVVRNSYIVHCGHLCGFWRRQDKFKMVTCRHSSCNPDIWQECLPVCLVVFRDRNQTLDDRISVSPLLVSLKGSSSLHPLNLTGWNKCRFQTELGSYAPASKPQFAICLCQKFVNSACALIRSLDLYVADARVRLVNAQQLLITCRLLKKPKQNE